MQSVLHRKPTAPPWRSATSCSRLQKYQLFTVSYESHTSNVWEKRKDFKTRTVSHIRHCATTGKTARPFYEQSATVYCLYNMHKRVRLKLHYKAFLIPNSLKVLYLICTWQEQQWMCTGEEQSDVVPITRSFLAENSSSSWQSVAG